MKFTRARDYRLYYGRDNSRILDIELDGGRSLMGHTPKGLSQCYKNSISRGLYTGLPSTAHDAALKSLRRLFDLPAKESSWGLLIFRTRQDAVAFLHTQGLTNSPDAEEYFSLFDPRLESVSGNAVVRLWRPFSGMSVSGDQEPGIVLPVIPQPGYTSPQVILYSRNLGLQPRDIEAAAQPQLYGLAHCSNLLAQAMEQGNFESPAKLRHQPRRHRQAWGIQKHWFAPQQWERFLPVPISRLNDRGLSLTGPYLYLHESAWAQIPEERWMSRRQHWLTQGLRIPQRARYVHILPSIASRQEADLVKTYIEELMHD